MSENHVMKTSSGQEPNVSTLKYLDGGDQLALYALLIMSRIKCHSSDGLLYNKKKL